MQEDLKWRILRIYDDGSMDLIGEPTNGVVYFYGALGYNNGVYLLNDICKNLYSRNGITARSVNLEDLEKWLTDEGKTARDTYSNETAKYGETQIYTGPYTYKPDIYGKTENNSDGYYDLPTEKTYDEDETNNTLSLTQTYYEIPIDTTNYGEGEKVIKNNNQYWLASRYVYLRSHTEYYYPTPEGVFGLHSISSIMNTDNLFYTYTYWSYGSRYNSIRPVVTIDSDIKITVSPTASSDTGTPHTINWSE